MDSNHSKAEHQHQHHHDPPMAAADTTNTTRVRLTIARAISGVPERIGHTGSDSGLSGDEREKMWARDSSSSSSSSSSEAPTDTSTLEEDDEGEEDEEKAEKGKRGRSDESAPDGGEESGDAVVDTSCVMSEAPDAKGVSGVHDEESHNGATTTTTTDHSNCAQQVNAKHVSDNSHSVGADDKCGGSGSELENLRADAHQHEASLESFRRQAAAARKEADALKHAVQTTCDDVEALRPRVKAHFEEQRRLMQEYQQQQQLKRLQEEERKRREERAGGEEWSLGGADDDWEEDDWEDDWDEWKGRVEKEWKEEKGREALDLQPTHQLRKVVSACCKTVASLSLRLSDAICSVADLQDSVDDEMVALTFDDCLLCCLRKTKERERLEQRLQAAMEGLKQELNHLDQLDDDLAALEEQLDPPYSDVQLWGEQLMAEGGEKVRATLQSVQRV